jgi:hypothetical protein
MPRCAQSSIPRGRENFFSFWFFGRSGPFLEFLALTGIPATFMGDPSNGAKQGKELRDSPAEGLGAKTVLGLLFGGPSTSSSPESVEGLTIHRPIPRKVEG